MNTNSEEMLLSGTRIWKFTVDNRELGFLGIDSSVNGRSCGGLRYIQDVDAEEIAGLARAMTLKYGFLGLPQGGAKAGIPAVPGESARERKNRLEAFGKALRPWLKNGEYFPGADMGVTTDDLGVVVKSAGIKLKPWRLGSENSGFYTAATVFAGIVAACRKRNRTIDTCSFALEGFGAVGSSLAGLIHEAGGRIVAVSNQDAAYYSSQGLDIPALISRRDRDKKNSLSGLDGASEITHEELLGLQVDILSLCARHNRITEENADSISAWGIVSGANNPVTAEGEEILARKKIMCLPDFVTNSGGVLGGTMDFAGISNLRIARFITDRFQPVYTDLFIESEKHDITIRAYAEQLAMDRHRRIKEESENSGIKKRAFQWGLSIYRAGLFPPVVMGRISMPYFRKLSVFRDY